jgi:hypothetical protein
MLGDIIRDFKTGITLSDESDGSERRSGLDRRREQHHVPTESAPMTANRRSHTKKPIVPRGRRGKTGATGAAGPAGRPGQDHGNEIVLLSAQVAELVRELQAQLTRIADLQAQMDHLTLGKARPGPRQSARGDS